MTCLMQPDGCDWSYFVDFLWDYGNKEAFKQIKLLYLDI